MENPTNNIYNILSCPEVQNVEPTKQGKGCVVCGRQINEGVLKEKAFSGNFNDWSNLKNPEGSHVCPPCRYSLQEGWMRNYPFIVGKKLVVYISKAIPKSLQGLNVDFRERSDLLNDLFDMERLNIGHQFIVCIPSSRKHMAFKATVNRTSWFFMVQNGDDSFAMDTKAMAETRETLQRMYSGGFSKAELRTGEYQPHKPAKYGIDEFFKDSKIIEKARGSKAFDLIVDLLYS